MKRKMLLIIVGFLILIGVTIGVIFTIYLNSNYYYSKKLISAIREEDMIAVQQIIERKPTCINTLPSVVANWWIFSEWRFNYPLIEACITGNIDLIELLIENGADVNCNNGFPPLSIIYRGKMDNWYNISLLLIKEGASLNYTTERTGYTIAVLEDIAHVPPLQTPQSYNKEVIKAFNYALENCDHNNVCWSRTLVYSASDGRIEAVKILLDQKYCDVNDTSFGKTALMFAARDSTQEMVQLLLDYGADKSIKNDKGKTAYDYAVEWGRVELEELLKP